MKYRMADNEICKNIKCPYYDTNFEQHCSGGRDNGTAAEQCLKWDNQDTMTDPTPEQVQEAKAYLRQWADHTASCRAECEHTILAALEAAQKERDAETMLCFQRTKEAVNAMLQVERANAEILRLAHEATTEEVRAEEMQHARDLEYDHAEALSAYAAKLEKAGGRMLETVWGSMAWDEMSAIWDAARKEKP